MREAKKQYQKPTLERMMLIPRENVLAACNRGTGTGPYPGLNCVPTCLLSTVQGPISPYGP